MGSGNDPTFALGGPGEGCGEIPFSKQLAVSTSNEAKTLLGIQSVQSAAIRAGTANFTEQADVVERRWTQHFDPMTDSRWQQSETRRGLSQEMEICFTASSLSSVQGKACSLKQSTIGFAVSGCVIRPVNREEKSKH